MFAQVWYRNDPHGNAPLSSTAVAIWETAFWIFCAQVYIRYHLVGRRALRCYYWPIVITDYYTGAPAGFAPFAISVCYHSSQSAFPIIRIAEPQSKPGPDPKLAILSLASQVPVLWGPRFRIQGSESRPQERTTRGKYCAGSAQATGTVTSDPQFQPTDTQEHPAFAAHVLRRSPFSDTTRHRAFPGRVDLFGPYSAVQTPPTRSPKSERLGARRPPTFPRLDRSWDPSTRARACAR